MNEGLAGSGDSWTVRAALGAAVRMVVVAEAANTDSVPGHA